MNIVVMGLGRIGLPTAALFARSGARVTGVDIRKEIVKETNAGKCGLVDEPGLADIVRNSVRSGNLKATLVPKEAISTADFVIICVPTPVDETKTPDYSAVEKASRTVGSSLRKGTVVIIESTIGPGIAEEIVRPILESESKLKAGKDFGLVSCPERSDPGNIVENMGSVPRIVGGLTPESTELVAALYHSAFGVKTVSLSDPRTANAVKLTENLFRDVNIALANEFALLYEKLGVDAIEVINACASKYNFMPHYPGAGVGGPCLVGDEFIFVVDSTGLHAVKIGEYVRARLDSGMAEVQYLGQSRIVKPTSELLTLSFDGGRSIFKRIQWFTARPYSGKVLRLRLATNRFLTVTPDHPMIVRTARGAIVRSAKNIQIGDEVPLAPAYVPPYQSEESIDMIDELRESGGIPPSKVKVKPLTWQLGQNAKLFRGLLRDAGTSSSRTDDYCRWNYLPLDKYMELEAHGIIPSGREDLALYTARGSACRVPAVLTMDEDFWRFVGYYCSEGCLYSEKGLRGMRERIKISFGAHETDLIDDCRTILGKWGITPSEETANGSHSLRFSSRIFGHLLRHILEVGTDSYSKRVPPQLFFSPLRSKASFLQGLFRGDGWVEVARGQTNRIVTLGFATTSPELFQGVLLILQGFGITPTCREISSKKSTVPAQALRITRYNDLKTVQSSIGGLPKLEAKLQGYYHATKKSTTTVDYDTFRTAFVSAIDEIDYEGSVYNLEVDGTHTFASSYGIVTHNCLPSNSYYLISEGIKAGSIPFMIRMAREINDRMPDHVVELVGEALNEVGKTIRGSKIAVLGVAYKPNVRDIQLTPIERVVSRLLDMGAKLELYDPMFRGEKVFGMRVRGSIRDAVKGADCIVIGTAHDEFKSLGLARLSKLVDRRSAFVDARNVVAIEDVRKAGFAFRGVGRKTG